MSEQNRQEAKQGIFLAHVDNAVYKRSLLEEFDRVMVNDNVSRYFYDLATKTYGLDNEHGLKAAIVALSNALLRKVNEQKDATDRNGTLA